MDEPLLEPGIVDELKSVCRATVGDELRSITYFDTEGVEQLYLRSDLEQTADLVGFAELERKGFHSQAAYQDTQLGAYQATVRMFENGYLTRVIEGGHGVWVTTDTHSMERFEELSVAIRSVLSGLTDDE